MQQLLWQQFMTVLRMGLNVLTLSLLAILMVITCYTSQWRAIAHLYKIKCADYCALTSLDTGLDVAQVRRKQKESGEAETANHKTHYIFHGPQHMLYNKDNIIYILSLS